MAVACTGRHWCDYVSWNPDFLAPMQLFIKRVDCGPDLMSELEANVRLFLQEVDAILATLAKSYLVLEAAQGCRGRRIQ
jgi:hypothetical protein